MRCSCAARSHPVVNKPGHVNDAAVCRLALPTDEARLDPIRVHHGVGFGPRVDVTDRACVERDASLGDLVEVSTASHGSASELGQRIAEFGGVAYVVDYGEAGSVGDTFQAVKSHEKVSALGTPGEADLTAHVDFTI